MAAPASDPSTSPHASFSPPSSVLIVGSGVFGLSTAYALARRPAFAQTTITVVDRSSPDGEVFPAPDASSVDTSRIIRADYADPAYAQLAADAQREWRKQGADDLGGEGRYSEAGLVLVAEEVPVPPPATSQPADGSAAPPSHQEKAKKTGMDYVRASWENVQAMAVADPSLADKIRLLPSKEAIREAVGTGGASGTWGYLNKASGWANAATSMQWLLTQVKNTGRVVFVSAKVASLVHDASAATVTGARLADGRVLSADLVIVAAGAWSPTLIDLTGRAVATAQVLSYMDITDEEQAQLASMPTLLSLTTGLFIITPSKNVLKVARHAYGYLNPVALSNADGILPQDPSSLRPGATTMVSLPWTSVDDASLSIPAEGDKQLRQALREMVPLPALHDRAFTHTRLCWYTDTPSGDFLIDYHPGWRGLFVATGGSGHGFKFLPVIGERIADCVMRDCPSEFTDKWGWKPDHEGGVAPAWDTVVTEDGSRGGKPGMILKEELAKV